MSTVIIDASKCENAECGECVDMCPMEIFSLDGDKIVTDHAIRMWTMLSRPA